MSNSDSSKTNWREPSRSNTSAWFNVLFTECQAQSMRLHITTDGMVNFCPSLTGTALPVCHYEKLWQLVSLEFNGVVELPPLSRIVDVTINVLKYHNSLMEKTKAENPVKLRLGRALWKRVKAHTPDFCEPEVCESLGHFAFEKFMERDVKSIKALIGKNTEGFDLELGAMISTVLKAGPESVAVPVVGSSAGASTSKATDETPRDVALKGSFSSHFSVLKGVEAAQALRVRKVASEQPEGSDEELQVPFVTDAAADLAMEHAIKKVGFDPPPGLKEALKKKAVKHSRDELKQILLDKSELKFMEEAKAGTKPDAIHDAQAVAAEEIKVVKPIFHGDAGAIGAIAGLLQRMKDDGINLEPTAPELTFASGSPETIQMLLENIRHVINHHGMGDRKDLAFKQMVNSMRNSGPWQVCRRMDEILAASPTTNLAGIQETLILPTMMLMMQERLGVHTFKSTIRFESCFREIHATDPALASLSGGSGMAKLETWVHAVFELTGMQDFSKHGWGLLDVLYMIAHFLWTTNYFYEDLTSLMRWLETADEETVGLFLVFKVFGKKMTEKCCRVMMHLARHIKSWCVHLKKHIVEDISSISTVLEKLKGSEAATPANVVKVATLAAEKARAKLDSVSRAFAESEAEEAVDEGALEESVEQVVSKEPTEEEEPEPEHYMFLPRKAADPWFLYPLRGWSRELAQSYEYFMEYRGGRNSRPADLKTISDWPKPLPYESIPAAWLGAPQCIASCKRENLSHKRNFAAQLLMIELRGALGWLDQQFHPLSAWTLHVQQILKRSVYLNRHQVAPRTSTRSYKTAARQLRTCSEACDCNDPDTFRRYMGIFNEKAFADELHAYNSKDQSSLSTHFGEMMVSVRGGLIGQRLESDSLNWVPGWEVDCIPLPNADPTLHGYSSHDTNGEIQSKFPTLHAWMVIINELASKVDHVAVLVADALCIGIASLFPKSKSKSLYLKSFTDMTFHPGFKFRMSSSAVAKFTDSTAPIYFCSYWRGYPTITQLSLEAAARIAISHMPRARFPDAIYADMVCRTKFMYTLFERRFKVDLGVNGYCDHTPGVVSTEPSDLPQEFTRTVPVRKAIKNSLELYHFGAWNNKEKLVAACALIKYAQDQRQTLHVHQEEKLKEAIPMAHAHGVLTRRMEIYTNLDQARILIDLVLATDKDYLGCEECGYALDFGLEVDVAKKAWKAADENFDRRVANAEKDQRKREAREEREREKAVAEVVRKCAKGACDAVRLRARKADRKAELNEAEEKLRQMEEKRTFVEKRLAAYECITRFVSWMPRVVRRKARSVQREAERKAREAREAAEAKARDEARARALAVAIERNRAAVKRRERHLVARAKVEQRALAQERREEAKARTQAYKTEQAERNARIRAEVEAAERARREREAKAAADAEAEAAAAIKEQIRAKKARFDDAAAAAREFRAQEAALVAEQQRLTEAMDPKRMAEEGCRARALEEATRAADEQRRRDADEQRRRDADAKFAAELLDADAKLAAAVQEREKAAVIAEATRAAWEAAEHAAKVATAGAAERARRAEQSRVERLVSQHAKELARDKFAKAFKLWRARARATHTARSVRESRDALFESRRAAQERCNAIFREGVKEAEEAKAVHKAKAEREREARFQADRAAEAALAAEKTKAEAAQQRPSWYVLRFGQREATKAAEKAKPKPVEAPAAAVASSSPSSSPPPPPLHRRLPLPRRSPPALRALRRPSPPPLAAP